MPSKEELEKERKEVQGELDQELEKSKDIDEKKPFDWLLHLMKSIMLTFQLGSLPTPTPEETKKKSKETSFKKDDGSDSPIKNDNLSKQDNIPQPKLSDSKMLSKLGVINPTTKPQVSPTAPIIPTATSGTSKDNADKEDEHQDTYSSPFNIDPFSTKLRHK